jgi:hypothetical protein
MMVHKSSLIPGISKFIDDNVLAHYPPTSMKRLLMAGAVSLYLKQNEGLVDSLASNPLAAGLGIFSDDGLVDIDAVRNTLKTEINKAGFMRLNIPMVGSIDFTPEDVDTLYNDIVQSNAAIMSANPTQSITSNTQPGGVF